MVPESLVASLAPTAKEEETTSSISAPIYNPGRGLLRPEEFTANHAPTEGNRKRSPAIKETTDVFFGGLRELVRLVCAVVGGESSGYTKGVSKLAFRYN